jgi:hypothetical protein
MNVTSKTLTTAVVAVVTAAFLAGCGPKNNTVKTANTVPVIPATTPATTPPTAAGPSPTATVKTLTAGNCTLYSKSDAVSLIGGVNFANPALTVNTAGGQKIDVCSYLDLNGAADIQGVSYAVVLYDSSTTAFAKAKQVQAEMLSDASEHSWAVQSLTTPVPGAGPLLGGTGTKTDHGITYTIAVVGTNVGSYLVVALGASTRSPAAAKNFALSLFQALSATAS